MVTDDEIVERLLDDPGLRYVLLRAVQESLTPMMVSRLLDTVIENVKSELTERVKEDLNDGGYQEA